MKLYAGTIACGENVNIIAAFRRLRVDAIVEAVEGGERQELSQGDNIPPPPSLEANR